MDLTVLLCCANEKKLRYPEAIVAHNKWPGSMPAIELWRLLAEHVRAPAASNPYILSAKSHKGGFSDQTKAAALDSFAELLQDPGVQADVDAADGAEFRVKLLAALKLYSKELVRAYNKAKKQKQKQKQAAATPEPSAEEPPSLPSDLSERPEPACAECEALRRQLAETDRQWRSRLSRVRKDICSEVESWRPLITRGDEHLLGIYDKMLTLIQKAE